MTAALQHFVRAPKGWRTAVDKVLEEWCFAVVPEHEGSSFFYAIERGPTSQFVWGILHSARDTVIVIGRDGRPTWDALDW